MEKKNCDQERKSRKTSSRESKTKQNKTLPCIKDRSNKRPKMRLEISRPERKYKTKPKQVKGEEGHFYTTVPKERKKTEKSKKQSHRITKNNRQMRYKKATT